MRIISLLENRLDVTFRNSELCCLSMCGRKHLWRAAGVSGVRLVAVGAVAVGGAGLCPRGPCEPAPGRAGHHRFGFLEGSGAPRASGSGVGTAQRRPCQLEGRGDLLASRKRRSAARGLRGLRDLRGGRRGRGHRRPCRRRERLSSPARPSLAAPGPAQSRFPVQGRRGLAAREAEGAGQD